MKALTIHQPYASLIAHGLKRFETRSWATTYRGILAIHASKQPMSSEMWHKAIRVSMALSPFPIGCVIAYVDLVDCLPAGDAVLEARPSELDFGYWKDGYYGWKLVNPRMLTIPVQVRGQQGLWEWDHTPVLSEAECVTTGHKADRERTPHA